ncbi:MAG: 50S ribosomal protein L10 [Candidatus Dojkabacteria bacterium]|nr:MAG: 50S ribosomal protein L10 [Candidatus Dojkabacteria bacterium]
MPKTKGQKEALFEKYKEIVDKSNFLVVEINNVPANALMELRKKLAAHDAQFVVVKNTVFQKAAASEESFADVTMEGPLAILEGGEDIVSSIKLFDEATKYAKQSMSLAGADDEVVSKYVPFTVRVGMINHRLLTASDAQRLATLPDKNTILAQFVGTLAAPISGVMNVMNGVSRNLVYALTDLKEKKAQTT